MNEFLQSIQDQQKEIKYPFALINDQGVIVSNLVMPASTLPLGYVSYKRHDNTLFIVKERKGIHYWEAILPSEFTDPKFKTAFLILGVQFDEVKEEPEE